jgi:hypothetical protein
VKVFVPLTKTAVYHENFPDDTSRYSVHIKVKEYITNGLAFLSSPPFFQDLEVKK